MRPDGKCLVEDYRVAGAQAVSSFDGVRLNSELFVGDNGMTCPGSCPGVEEIIGDGFLPKSTLKCPRTGIEVRLGRVATITRSIIAE